jgi:hypothetical protein
MWRLIFIIFLFSSCVLWSGYRDYKIRPLKKSSAKGFFVIGVKATYKGDVYVVDASTPYGRCTVYLPLELTYIHEKGEDYKPFIRIVSNCGNEESYFRLCGPNKKSGCYEYHLFVPKNMVFKRLLCENI